MTSGQNERNIQAYEEAYSTEYDFETLQVRYRREAVLRSLLQHKPRRVIEIGCGLEPLLPHFLAEGGTGVECWVVAEPANAFVRAAQAVAKQQPAMKVVQGFFEEVAGKIVATYGRADMVICSGLLHEVPDQMALLRVIRTSMAPHAVLHVNVPSATSLHRRLALAMGLIRGLRDASDRNVKLQQPRVYDRQALRDDLLAAGLQPVAEGGIFMKPFTHAQMERVVQVLGEGFLPGLSVLGQEFPELASEIFIEAVLRNE